MTNGTGMVRTPLLLAALLLAGCAGGEGEPAEEFSGTEASTREACRDYRTMLAEVGDDPSDDEFTEQIDTIRVMGGLADDDRVRTAAESMSAIETEEDLEAWVYEMGEACDQAGY